MITVTDFLIIYFQTHNPISHTEPPWNKPYEWKCPFCSRILTSKSAFTQHVGEKHGAHAKNVSCDICGKKFSTRRVTDNHMRIVHEGNHKYQCGLCHKGFIQKGDLDGHMNVHKGVRPYICHLCPSSFSYKKHMVAHMRSKH